MPRARTDPRTAARESRDGHLDVTPELAARMNAALSLAAQGFLIGHCYGVNPDGRCGCGLADCLSQGKHGGEGWKDQATQDPEVIRTRFLDGSPNYIAIPRAGS